MNAEELQEELCKLAARAIISQRPGIVQMLTGSNVPPDFLPEIISKMLDLGTARLVVKKAENQLEIHAIEAVGCEHLVDFDPPAVLECLP